MGRNDARVDAYIANSADFARPIPKHLRKVVQRGCPGVVEEIKWGSPHFNYRGMFCGMAAFKAHCVFGFLNRALGIERSGDAMGQFGCLGSLDDLPSDTVLPGCVPKVPAVLTAALRKKAGALAKFAERARVRVPSYLEISSIAAARRASVIRVGEYFRTTPLRSTKTNVGVAETP